MEFGGAGGCGGGSALLWFVVMDLCCYSQCAAFNQADILQYMRSFVCSWPPSCFLDTLIWCLKIQPHRTHSYPAHPWWNTSHSLTELLSLWWAPLWLGCISHVSGHQTSVISTQLTGGLRLPMRLSFLTLSNTISLFMSLIYLFFFNSLYTFLPGLLHLIDISPPLLSAHCNT